MSDRRDVVLLHYFGGASRSWQWVEAHLRAETVYAPDLPGFGRADPLTDPTIANYARWIAEQIEARQLRNVTLVGHSMSGKLALQVALDRPDLIGRAILVAPSPPTQEPMDTDEKMEKLRTHPSRSAAIESVHDATVAQISIEQVTVAVQTQLAVADSAWKWWLMQGMNNPIADKLYRLAIPVTVVASRNDPVIPLEKLREDFERYLASAEFVITQNVGHLIPLEAADWLAQIINDNG